MESGRTVIQDDFKNALESTSKLLHTRSDHGTFDRDGLSLNQLPNGANLPAVFISARSVKKKVSNGPDLEPFELLLAFPTYTANQRNRCRNRVARGANRNGGVGLGLFRHVGSLPCSRPVSSVQGGVFNSARLMPVRPLTVASTFGTYNWVSAGRWRAIWS